MKSILRVVFDLLICVILCLCLTCTAYANDTVSGLWGYLTWELNEDGCLTISGNGSMK